MRVRLCFVALALILAIDLGVLLRTPSIWAIPLALLGWFAADLVSGIVHMYMDYRPSPPGIGLDRLYFFEGSRESAEYLELRAATLGKIGAVDRLTYDFKNHHPRPDALGRRSLVTLAGPTVVAGTLPLAVAGSAVILLSNIPDLMLAPLVSFVIGTSFAQYFHGTLHRADISAAVRGMRLVGLLMRPDDHAHHHDTLDRDFSTINGWSNPVLNPVFRVLQRYGYLSADGLVPG